MPWAWMVQDGLTHMASGCFSISWGWFGLCLSSSGSFIWGLRVLGRTRKVHLNVQAFLKPSLASHLLTFHLLKLVIWLGDWVWGNYPKAWVQGEQWFFPFKKKYFIYLFLERREGREKKRERNINVWEKHQMVASTLHPNQGPACNPGMCPAQELNHWPFALWNGAQPTELHWSGPFPFCKIKKNKKKKKNHKNLCLCASLSSQLALVISSCVCACVCVFLCLCTRECRKERGCVIWDCNQGELREHYKKLFVSLL